MSRRVTAAVVFAAALSAGRSTSAWQEIQDLPETFTNLKVLPANITRQQMLDLMKGVGRSLGVECTHCHAPKAGAGKELDYASDAKEVKRVARVMMHMTNDINAKVRSVADDAVVSCWTCHRGEEAPEPIPPPPPPSPSPRPKAR